MGNVSHDSDVELYDFPHRYGATRHFTLGEPRDFSISADGQTVLFVRSSTGTDAIKSLWSMSLADFRERPVVDPSVLLEGKEQEYFGHERDLREHVRELSDGISTYSADAAHEQVVFSLSGRLWIVDTRSGAARELPATFPAFDPRLDAAGSKVAYVSDGALHVIETDGTSDVCLAGDEAPDVQWGVAEYVAAGAMGRTRGHWWAPNGQAVLAARVDNTQVTKYYISDPIDPTQPPRAISYPAVGTRNATVTLWICHCDGSKVEVTWDWVDFEYVTAVRWAENGLLVVLQDRSQKRMQILEVDAESGATQLRLSDSSDFWLVNVPGLPALLSNGELVWSAHQDGCRRLLVNGVPVTPPGLVFRGLIDVDGDTLLISGSEEPSDEDLWTWSQQTGLARVTSGAGVHRGRRAGGTTVVSRRCLEHAAVDVSVYAGGEEVAKIGSVAEPPGVSPRVQIRRAGDDALRTVLLMPSGDMARESSSLPVLLDPYGGPMMQRVTASQDQYWVSQWFADQGFAVIVTDGHGTPGRGTDWARSIRGDTLSKPLEDQVTALQWHAARHPELDLSRVAIRGWSYGGFLASAAVLRRPDVFSAAIALASDPDARLYSTYFKERVVGDPFTEPENYQRCSLISEAPKLERDLMIIHGMSDDNVVVGHSLRLSAALLAAGKPHTVLMLSGVTHMTPQPVIAQNLLLLELDFLRRTLLGRGSRAETGRDA